MGYSTLMNCRKKWLQMPTQTKYSAAGVSKITVDTNISASVPDGIIISVCLYPSFLNQLTDFHETRYKRHSSRIHPTFQILIFPGAERTSRDGSETNATSYKVKVNLSLCFLTEHHTMKAYWGSGVTAPRILDLSTRWRRVVGFKLRPLYLQGKSPSYPLDRRLGGPQSRSGRGGKEKNSQLLPEIEP
jgi:hypothetical protein